MFGRERKSESQERRWKKRVDVESWIEGDGLQPTLWVVGKFRVEWRDASYRLDTVPNPFFHPSTVYPARHPTMPFSPVICPPLPTLPTAIL